jgi:hypothetical protein
MKYVPQGKRFPLSPAVQPKERHCDLWNSPRSMHVKKTNRPGDKTMTKEELQKVREWADREIAAAELPSAWYQLMKLREALDAILGGIGALPVIVSELSPEAPRPPARGHLRLVDTDQSDSARPE